MFADEEEHSSPDNFSMHFESIIRGPFEGLAPLVWRALVTAAALRVVSRRSTICLTHFSMAALAAVASAVSGSLDLVSGPFLIAAFLFVLIGDLLPVVLDREGLLVVEVVECCSRPRILRRFSSSRCMF